MINLLESNNRATTEEGRNNIYRLRTLQSATFQCLERIISDALRPITSYQDKYQSDQTPVFLASKKMDATLADYEAQHVQWQNVIYRNINLDPMEQHRLNQLIPDELRSSYPSMAGITFEPEGVNINIDFTNDPRYISERKFRSMSATKKTEIIDKTGHDLVEYTQIQLINKVKLCELCGTGQIYEGYPLVQCSRCNSWYHHGKKASYAKACDYGKITKSCIQGSKKRKLVWYCHHNDCVNNQKKKWDESQRNHARKRAAFPRKNSTNIKKGKTRASVGRREREGVRVRVRERIIESL